MPTSSPDANPPSGVMLVGTTPFRSEHMYMFSVIECAVPKIGILIKATTNKNQCSAGDFLFLHSLMDRGQCGMKIGLVRPANPVGNNHRTIGTIERRQDPSRSDADCGSTGGLPVWHRFGQDWRVPLPQASPMTSSLCASVIRLCVTSGTVNSMPSPAAAAA